MSKVHVDPPIFGALFFAALLGMVMGGSIIYFTTYEVELSQETADDICIELTGNESVIADSQGGKLICRIPTFNSTPNIIVKGGNE